MCEVVNRLSYLTCELPSAISVCLGGRPVIGEDTRSESVQICLCSLSVSVLGAQDGQLSFLFVWPTGNPIHRG